LKSILALADLLNLKNDIGAITTCFGRNLDIDENWHWQDLQIKVRPGLLRVKKEGVMMNGSTIFIAGVYGTGKSTLCFALSERLHIPAYSAGDLISALNGERYGANKTVADKDNNQVLLSEYVRKLNQKYEQIILAGHFCIFNSNNDVEVLPESVYHALNITRIVLLEADTQTIIDHLKKRDGKNYSKESVIALSVKERIQSERIATQLKCQLDIFKMTFTKVDLDHIAALLYIGG